MMVDGTKILIVDDHTLVRQVLVERLAREADFTILEPAATADEALEAVAGRPPDLILMDIDMPGLNCFEAARRIRAIRPQVRIVFLSGHVHDGYVGEALAVQASGYITKSEPLETVIAAIREVAAGGAYFSREVRRRIVIDSSGVRLSTMGRSRIATLTPREKEILQYIAKGLGKREIASTMHLSIKTVDHHQTRLMRKLDIHDRVEIVRFAIREGLAKP